MTRRNLRLHWLSAQALAVKKRGDAGIDVTDLRSIAIEAINP